MNVATTRKEFDTLMHEHRNVSPMNSLESSCHINICHQLYDVLSKTGDTYTLTYFTGKNLLPWKNTVELVVSMIFEARSDEVSRLD